MKTLATVFLIVWVCASLVAYGEGLKPRGSASFKALNFFVETSAVALAAWVLIA